MSDWVRHDLRKKPARNEASRKKAAAKKPAAKAKGKPKAKASAAKAPPAAAKKGAAAKKRAAAKKGAAAKKPAARGLKLPDQRPDWRLVAAGGGLVAAAVFAWAVVAGPLSSDDEPEVETKVVTVAIETDDAADAPVGPLGFPLVATRNTTRVGGPDPASDAAAVALATHPPSSLAAPVESAVLVEDTSPYAGIAAASLAAPPLRAPLLIGASGELPEPTADALAKLNPTGGGGGAAVYRVGEVGGARGIRDPEGRERIAGRGRLRGRRAADRAPRATPATS